MADETIAAEGTESAPAGGTGAQVETVATTETQTETVATAAPSGDAVVPDFPDDWREKLAGGDEKLLGELKRYKSLKNWSDAGHAARQRIRSGELKASTPFPVEGDDAAKAAWRTENGLPADPKGYLENLDGLVIGEADQPIIEAFVAEMHSENASPAAVKRAVAWYYDHVGQMEAAQAEKDQEYKVNTLVALKQEMGPEFDANIRALSDVLSVGVRDVDGNISIPAPEGLFSTLMTARAQDGSVLGNHPDVLRFFSQVGSYLNPTATIAPSSGDVGGKGIADEIASIEKFMKEDYSAYMKDAAKQARLLKLYEARERSADRAA